MKIVIAGGGVAGWLTAAILDKNFNSGPEPLIDISVVESSSTGRIGVGEATVPTLRRTLAFLGVDESEFLRVTSATLKHGIRFLDWAAPGHIYFHPFEAFAAGQAQPSLQDWMIRYARRESRPFAYDMGSQVYAADAGRSPKRFDDPDYGGYFTYAYHLDAELFADFLQSLCLKRGVTRLERTIGAVRLYGDQGNIAALQTPEGEIEGDFFVDCTGFSSLLLRKGLGVPFISFADQLLCDRAVAIRRPYDGALEEIEPFTTSKAVDAGWAWRIGLRDRAGHGYVYGSAFISDDEAEQALRRIIGGADGLESRLIKFEVGRAAHSWHRNCVAIGLSGGFIEPLESTGIFLLEEAARLLSQSLPLSGSDAAAAAAFNRHIGRLYDEIRDFVVLHYCISRRRDSAFWREVESRVPDRLVALLSLWEGRPPLDEDLDSSFLFNSLNYRYILYGMDHVPERAVERARLSPVPLRDDGLERKRAEALRLLPGHLAWLQAKTVSS